MKINPVEFPKLIKSAPRPFFFGTELDENSSSDQFLLSIYDSVQTSIFIVDVLEDGDFRYFALNPTHERWLGISSEELRGKKPEDILSPMDAMKVRQHYADCVRFGKTISYEQCLQFQGVNTWWSTTLTPLQNAESRIYRLIGTSTNITPSKLVEQTGIKQAEAQRLLTAITLRICQGEDLATICQQTVKEIRHLLDSDRIIIYRLETENTGVIVAESTIMAGESLLGKKIQDSCFDSHYQEHYRRGCIQVIEDIYAAGLHPCQKKFLDSMQVQANLVIPILLQQHLWGLLMVQHCRDKKQWQQEEIDLCKQIGLQLSIATQQAELQKQVKYLQEKLEKQQQQYTSKLQKIQDFHGLIRKITEQIRDHLDINQVLENAVQELSKLLQLERCYIEIYNPSQTSTTVTCEYNSHCPYFQELKTNITDLPEVYQLLLQKQTWQSVNVIPDNYQKIQIVAQIACPIFDIQGILGNIWLIKLTEEKFKEVEISLVQEVANECAIAIRQSQLKEKTKAQVKEIEKRERRKHEFLKTLSQELRTPVTNINLAAQTLESLLTSSGIIDIELVPQLLQILHNECGRESKLINDLLTLTHLKIEPEPPTLIPIDLNNWLTSIVASFRDVTHCQKQNLNLHIPQEIPPLQTDITDFERIISELINHACQCTPPGETITVAANLGAEVIELTVSYSGVEIPQHEIGKVFQPFYRFAKNPPWKTSDSGLELALVKEMVKRLSGNINVQSNNKQITFSVTFPLHPVF